MYILHILLCKWNTEWCVHMHIDMQCACVCVRVNVLKQTIAYTYIYIYGGFHKWQYQKMMVNSGKSHSDGWYRDTPISANLHVYIYIHTRMITITYTVCACSNTYIYIYITVTINILDCTSTCNCVCAYVFLWVCASLLLPNLKYVRESTPVIEIRALSFHVNHLQQSIAMYNILQNGPPTHGDRKPKGFAPLRAKKNEKF